MRDVDNVQSSGRTDALVCVLCGQVLGISCHEPRDAPQTPDICPRRDALESQGLQSQRLAHRVCSIFISLWKRSGKGETARRRQRAANMHVYVLIDHELRESPSNFNFVRKLVHRRVGNV